MNNRVTSITARPRVRAASHVERHDNDVGVRRLERRGHGCSRIGRGIVIHVAKQNALASQFPADHMIRHQQAAETDAPRGLRDACIPEELFVELIFGIS